MEIIKCENPFCEKEFGYTPRGKRKRKYCDIKCTRKAGNHKLYLKTLAKHLEKYDDLPQCVICGYLGLHLTQHLLTQHKLSTADYMKNYERSPSDIYHSSYLNKCSERISGKNNPAYDHGGKFSPFSNKFIRYRNIPVNERNKAINDLCAAATTNRNSNNNQNTSVEFYIKHFNVGYDEAVRMRSERQSTFSLDICIEKYGEQIGSEIWQDRQDKWQETLLAKSQEEIQDINRRKRPIGGASALAEDLFDSLCDLYDEASREFLYFQSNKYDKNESRIKLSDGKIIKPDFLDTANKIIIEFYGDYWHANPNKFDESFYNSSNYLTFNEIRNHDMNRESRIRESEWNLYVVWEQDYNNDKDRTLKSVFSFINATRIPTS